MRGSLTIPILFPLNNRNGITFTIHFGYAFSKVTLVFVIRLLENHLIGLLDKGRLSVEKKGEIARFSVASVLLFLRAIECIDENEYSKLVELNDSRNKLVHKGVLISPRISKKCPAYCEGIIRKNITEARLMT